MSKTRISRILCMIALVSLLFPSAVHTDPGSPERTVLPHAGPAFIYTIADYAEGPTSHQESAFGALLTLSDEQKATYHMLKNSSSS